MLQSLEARERAELFRRLHAGPQPLVLVNAWDAGSARVLEHAGAPAIATTSAGMAWSLGYADGERLPPDELLAACARICRGVHIPVSVDIERGFGRDTESVCAIVRALMGQGVVGVNIEDGVLPGTQHLAPAGILCERIAAIRALARREGAMLFINARTDTYVAANSDPAARYDETVRRAELYTTAGADGIFVPGLDLMAVARFVRAARLPVNVYAGAGWAPPVQGLAQAGVRRVSLGCGPLQSAFGLLRQVAVEAFRQGSYTVMSSNMLPAGDINNHFAQ